MSKEDELRDVLNETANEIAHLDRNPRTWLAWVTYLLERLEQQATDVNPTYQQSYREMLTMLQDVIRNRLKTGGW
jgi:hypothetical protein